MSPAPWAEVRRFATLPSTNTYVLDEARRGAPAGLVAVAEHQTAGRGRLGRRWEAPPGACLLCSVLLRPVLPPDRLYLCTAAVALAAADACAVAAGVVAGIKWPNDLVVGDRKLAGVLAEADFDATGERRGSIAVVVGVGCNIDWPGPPDAGGTCARREAGRPVDREALLEAFLAALAPRAARLDDAGGRLALAAELRHRCVTLGRRVRVTLPTGAAVTELEGVASALTDEGHLVVVAGGETHQVSAADVVHLRPVDGPPAAEGRTAAGGSPGVAGTLG
ncbi:MAG: biotin--[acetyl-CoA-carboxylase] ligase [Acidimicrobiales bacterium]